MSSSEVFLKRYLLCLVNHQRWASALFPRFRARECEGKKRARKREKKRKRRARKKKSANSRFFCHPQWKSGFRAQSHWAGKRERARDRGKETEGRRQRGRDRGEETEGKRQRGRDRREETEGEETEGEETEEKRQKGEISEERHKRERGTETDKNT